MSDCIYFCYGGIFLTGGFFWRKKAEWGVDYFLWGFFSIPVGR